MLILKEKVILLSIQLPTNNMKKTQEEKVKEAYRLLGSERGKKRWKNKTKEERSEHGKMMANSKKKLSTDGAKIDLR